MKSLKKIFSKKRDGNFADILGTCLCIILLFTIIIAIIQYMQLLSIKREINNIGREYLLLLEEQGQLTSADIVGCQNKLQKLGFKEPDIHINFNGTEGTPLNTKANYAKEVCMDIEVTGAASDLNVNSSIPGFDNNYTFRVKLYSISKH